MARLGDSVRIEYSTRLSRSLGRSLPSRGLIRLHAELEFESSALRREVLCHELAHVAVAQAAGGGSCGHGPAWAALVVQAGYRPTTCLRVPDLRPAPKRTRRRYAHICHHQERGIQVHLFVRRTSKTQRGMASPFTYCGELEHISSQGDKPITVQWRLLTPVPERLWGALEVPET